MKSCSKCKVEKELSEFAKDKYRPDGLTCRCKTCKKQYDTEFYPTYKDKKAVLDKIRYNKDKEYFRHYSKEYKIRNKIKVKLYRQNRLKTNVQERIKNSLRSRLSKVLNGRSKVGSAIKDLGCSIQELKEHLEKQFKLGMTWNNRGFGENKWNIDHIFPLSKVDLTDREQLLKVCHYTNLQPMWQPENLSKSNSTPQLLELSST